VYRALVSLHGAITFDLNTRALPLPRIVVFQAPSILPTLWVANRLYGDAGRESELRAENNLVHPAFMPPTIRALSQ
jgi:prophage DNA circulation protein